MNTVEGEIFDLVKQFPGVLVKFKFDDVRSVKVLIVIIGRF